MPPIHPDAGRSHRNGWPEIRCRLPGRQAYAPGMGKRDHRKPQPDIAAVLDGLRSPDAQARARALHAVCPCAAGFQLYEQLRDALSKSS